MPVQYFIVGLPKRHEKWLQDLAFFDRLGDSINLPMRDTNDMPLEAGFMNLGGFGEPTVTGRAIYKGMLLKH